MARRLLPALLAAALALALPAAASAASRYASPSGSGTTCSAGSPCKIETAINNATNGDDIYVPGNLGDYSTSTTMTPAAVVHIHGTNGRPRIILTGFASLRIKGTSTAENLFVDSSADNTAFALDGSGTSANNIIAKNSNGSGNHACYLEGSTLTNSVCWNPVSTSSILEMDGSNTVRNVTVYAGATSSSNTAILAYGRAGGGCPCTDTFVNVIARGGSAGKDVDAHSEDNQDITVNWHYSNGSVTKFTTAHTTVNQDATDQTAAPLFVNAAAGDFHEKTGSPTIDKGQNSAANGAADFDGDARTINGTTDIGADEIRNAQSPPPPDTTPPDTVIVGGPSGTVASKTAYFAFASTEQGSTFFCSLDGGPFGGCSSPLAYTASATPTKAYRALANGPHTFRVSAQDAAGNIDPTPAVRSWTITTKSRKKKVTVGGLTITFSVPEGCVAAPDKISLRVTSKKKKGISKKQFGKLRRVKIKRVDFYLDGKRKARDKKAAFKAKLATLGLAPGQHKLKAKVALRPLKAHGKQKQTGKKFKAKLLKSFVTVCG